MRELTPLEESICEFLKTRHGHPTNSEQLIEMAGGKWRRIDAAMVRLRKAGIIIYHGRGKNRPLDVPAHGWEVVR